MHCPGSVRLYAQLPERHETEYAATGTAAHSICEWCLLDPKKEPEMFLGMVIDTKEYHITVTEQMVEATRVYVDHVRSQHRKHGGRLMVEQPFDLSWVHPGMFGRNDSCIIPDNTFGGVLRAFDYKNGRKQVDAEENPQLMYYGLGALGQRNPWFVEYVEITIIQPNGIGKNPIDVWGLATKPLYEWAMDVLRPAAIATEAPDAPCCKGGWCTFCEAAAICPLKRDSALALLGESDPAHPVATLPSISALTPEEIGLLSAFFTSEEFSAWVKALAAAEQAALARGVIIPGRKLAETTALSNRKWTDEAAVGKAFKSYGEDIYNVKLKSPAQLTAVLTKAGVPKSEARTLVDKFTTRDEIKTIKVVNDDGSPELCPFSPVSDSKSSTPSLFD